MFTTLCPATTVSARSQGPFDQKCVTLSPPAPRASACAYQVGVPFAAGFAAGCCSCAGGGCAGGGASAPSSARATAATRASAAIAARAAWRVMGAELSGGPAYLPRVRVALSIAGSDPTGGAGLQADLQVFRALGVHGAGVVTAL